MDRMDLEIAYLGFRFAVLCLFVIGSIAAFIPLN